MNQDVKARIAQKLLNLVAVYELIEQARGLPGLAGMLNMQRKQLEMDILMLGLEWFATVLSGGGERVFICPESSEYPGPMQDTRPTDLPSDVSDGVPSPNVSSPSFEPAGRKYCIAIERGDDGEYRPRTLGFHGGID